MARALLISLGIMTVVAVAFIGMLIGLGLYPYSTAGPRPTVVMIESPRHPTLPMSKADWGAELYQANCSSCHDTKRIDPDIGNYPGFYNLYGSERLLDDGTTVIADADYIRESITDPGAKIVAGYPNVQSAFAGFSDRELDDLVEFLKALSENHDEPTEPLRYFDWHLR